MIIGHTIINAEVIDIIIELRSQLLLHGVDYFKDIKESGNNIQVTCPYHNDGHERRPSGGFHKNTGVFNCFTCHESHSLEEVISHCFGKDDFGLFGKQWILKNFASVTIEDRKDINIDTRCSDSIKPSLKYIDDDELDKYRYYHPYWNKRGITNDDIIELFDLGYDDSTKCITFPVKDVSGNCLFVARRSVNMKWFNYPPNANKPIYGAYELTQLKEYPKEVIICESMLDALIAWQYGKYAVALNGTGTRHQYELLNKMPCRKFVLATDMDEAGLKARYNLKKNLSGKLISEYVWDIEKAKDLNDMSKDMFLNLREVW